MRKIVVFLVLCNGANNTAKEETSMLSVAGHGAMNKEYFCGQPRGSDASWTFSFPPEDNPSMQVVFR